VAFQPQSGIRPLTQGDLRRFYNGQHRFYAGIDLHASFMHVCVLDAAGNVV
jgi:hypothetical protein